MMRRVLLLLTDAYKSSLCPDLSHTLMFYYTERLFKWHFPNKWNLTEAGRVYLDVDDGGFIGGDAEHGGVVLSGGKLRRLVHVLHLNGDLRRRKSSYSVHADQKSRCCSGHGRPTNITQTRKIP